MLSWAITFLIIAIIAAVLGFGGIAGTATGIAKILFVVFLVLFVASLIFGRGRLRAARARELQRHRMPVFPKDAAASFDRGASPDRVAHRDRSRTG